MSDITRPIVVKAMKEDLAESGITTRHQISKLAFRPLTPTDCEKLTNYRLPGYEIPYFDSRGRKLSKFSRIKFLAEVPDSPGQKYWQPPDTLPHVYLPPFLSRFGGWDKIFSDPSIPLYVTEGEKKAACGCVNDLPVLGLGGVWSFRSKKTGKKLLSELEKIVWKDRVVFIVYDNDVMYKAEVLRAMDTFASTLLARGVGEIRSLYLTDETSEEKIGLDDFVVANGVEALFEVESSPSSELLSRLNEMNTRYMIVREQGDKIFDLRLEKFHSYQGFLNVAESANRVDTIDENNKPKKVSVAREWLTWPNRRELRNIVFRPGEDKVTEDNNYNMWHGMGYAPKRGSVKPFLELRDNVFEKMPKDVVRWFMQWLAFPIQNPGTKLNTAVIVWGSQGTGKTFLGRIIKTLYGEHGRWITQGSMTSGFNPWAAQAQFVLADEVIFHGDRRESNMLKNVITKTEITINEKFQPAYTVDDYANYYFTSNYSDAITIDKDDRRFLVVEAGEKRPQKFYDGVQSWLNRPGSYEAILYYLMHNVRTDYFRPAGAAPQTASREDMIHEGMSSLDQVIDEALSNPDEFFRVGGEVIDRDLFTAQEVMALLPRSLSSATINAVGRSLRRAGALKKLINVGGTTKRVYAVRNQERWMYETPAEMIRHYGKRSNVVSFDEERKRRGK